MLNLHHPDDERLSALASHDDEATADAALTSHVDACARCADLVTELGAIRVSLSDLPDLRPSRPLQLLPRVAESPAPVGAAGWMRRLFAPALTAGAALAMVGVIGTAAPALNGMAGSGDGLFQNVGTELGGDPQPAEGEAVDAPASESTDDGRSAVTGGDDLGDGDAGAVPDEATPGAEGEGEGEGWMNREESEGGVSRFERSEDQLPAERSPWPMVLFTGVALMAAAGLLRWILVPRAG